jgi:hypothetical protein
MLWTIGLNIIGKLRKYRKRNLNLWDLSWRIKLHCNWNNYRKILYLDYRETGLEAGSKSKMANLIVWTNKLKRLNNYTLKIEMHCWDSFSHYYQGYCKPYAMYGLLPKKKNWFFSSVWMPASIIWIYNWKKNALLLLSWAKWSQSKGSFRTVQ